MVTIPDAAEKRSKTPFTVPPCTVSRKPRRRNIQRHRDATRATINCEKILNVCICGNYASRTGTYSPDVYKRRASIGSERRNGITRRVGASKTLRLTKCAVPGRQTNLIAYHDGREGCWQGSSFCRDRYDGCEQERPKLTNMVAAIASVATLLLGLTRFLHMGNPPC